MYYELDLFRPLTTQKRRDKRGSGRIRTNDLRCTNALPYHLSQPAMYCAKVQPYSSKIVITFKNTNTIGIFATSPFCLQSPWNLISLYICPTRKVCHVSTVCGASINSLHNHYIPGLRWTLGPIPPSVTMHTYFIKCTQQCREGRGSSRWH